MRSVNRQLHIPLKTEMASKGGKFLCGGGGDGGGVGEEGHAHLHGAGSAPKAFPSHQILDTLATPQQATML